MTITRDLAATTGAEIHRLITRAVGARLTGSLKTPVLHRGSVERGLRRFITVALDEKAASGILEDQAMATAARNRLAMTLRGDAQAAFSVELAAKADDLSLEVEGFGQVRFPVTAAKARKLIGLGRPARFGRGEETLTDPDVRSS